MPSIHIHTLFRHASAPDRARAFVVVVLLALSLCLLTARPAAAHDQLVSSMPHFGEHLSAAPSEVVLAFSAPLMALGYEVRVEDAAGTNWAQGDPYLLRETLTQPVASNLPSGEYQVQWRVVSSDGHPIGGSYTFGVGIDAEPGTAIARPSDMDPDATKRAVPPVPGADEAPPMGIRAWAGAAGIGAGTGLGIYLLWFFLQRRRPSRTENS